VIKTYIREGLDIVNKNKNKNIIIIIILIKYIDNYPKAKIKQNNVQKK